MTKMNVCTIVCPIKIQVNALNFFKRFIMVKYYEVMLVQIIQ